MAMERSTVIESNANSLQFAKRLNETARARK